MQILGLTGSIGMGKSTLANMVRRLNVPVHDADAVVHELLGPNGLAVAKIAKIFPSVVENNCVNRVALGAKVFNDPKALKALEAILHPLVRAAERAFIAKHRRARRKMVVLDIPLLFETKGEARCDYVLVVSAPAFLQRQRVMARPNMTDDKFKSILKKQLPDQLKRRRADHVIASGLGRASAMAQLKKILSDL